MKHNSTHHFINLKAVVPSGQALGFFKTPQVTEYGAKTEKHCSSWGKMGEWFIRKLVGKSSLFSWVAGKIKPRAADSFLPA